MQRISDLAVSPDGAWVAFTVSNVDLRTLAKQGGPRPHDGRDAFTREPGDEEPCQCARLRNRWRRSGRTAAAAPWSGAPDKLEVDDQTPRRAPTGSSAGSTAGAASMHGGRHGPAISASRRFRCHVAATRLGGGRDQRVGGGNPVRRKPAWSFAGTRDGWSSRLALAGFDPRYLYVIRGEIRRRKGARSAEWLQNDGGTSASGLR